MDPEQEPQPGPGDETEDDAPRSAFLHPDDRLWRHPSEVRANPSPAARPPTRGVGRVINSTPGRSVFIGVLSGCAGALVCAAVLVATGTLNRPAPVVETPSRTIGTTAGRSTVTTDPAALVDEVEPWVVGISVNGANDNDAYGSGVVVSTQGNECYVLTDSGIFSEAGTVNQIQVETYSGLSKVGSLVGTDQSEGIAVVKVAWAPATTADPGTVADLQTGEDVYAVGSPSLAVQSGGIYFASGSITDEASYLQPPNGGSAMFSMMVADFSVDPSAYGGALVTSDGTLVGITNPVSSQLQRPDLTYVTPIDTAMADASWLIRYDRTAPHPWLGMLQATDISGQQASQLGVAGAVDVASVASGSPLAKAGLTDNDVITAIDGRSTPSTGAIIAWLADAKPGQVADVNWLHQGHQRRADVTLGAQPSSASSN